jgi:hypothetical protein
MTPYDPREVLNGFLEYLDHIQNAEDPEISQRLMDWLAVEALESKELLDEVDLLLALKMNIEADCFQSSVEEPEVPEKIPAYRRPALETLLAKWRQNLNRQPLDTTQEIYSDKEHLIEGFSLACRSLDLGSLDPYFWRTDILRSRSILRSRELIREEAGNLNAQRIEETIKTLIYEGPDLSVRTAIKKLRAFFGETFVSRPDSAKTYRILAEIRFELADFNSNSIISEELANNICQRLGWNVCFRANNNF